LTTPPLFSFEDVRLSLAGRTVLDGVNVDVRDCGISVLAGPSGSGKSTVLRLCNRLAVADSGTVRFRGEDVTALDPLSHRRRVGMVFQRAATFPGTVRDNLLVACPESDEDALVEVLDRAGLHGSFLERQADDLSGGEAQRACLARTLLTEPEVLLLDEPTSALDPAASRELEVRVRMLADAGVGVVWVTHDLAQVRRIADEVHVVVEGRCAAPNEADGFLQGDQP
jgi:putative ABC transport system ATP-binding protein